VSKRIEKEAAEIYYGEDRFKLKDVCNVDCFAGEIWLRHLRKIRTVTCTWDESTTGATNGFQALARMTSLAELVIRTDEKKMLQKMLYSEKRHQRTVLKEPTPQQQLLILQFPGMRALLSLSGLRRMKFAKKYNNKGIAYGGPIPGGVLQTQVAAKLRKSREGKTTPG